ncbi:MAG: diaminopropionate ammonia-lyase [Pseudomonadota bacterium]
MTLATTSLHRFEARHVHNEHGAGMPAEDPGMGVFSLPAFDAAWSEIRSWPDYDPTPLAPLPGLASELDIGALYHKDEGKRFRLMSFKALGGAYAVLNLLKGYVREKHGLDTVSSSDLMAGHHLGKTTEITVATATDGNHGRSVAWGAEQFGCGCKIYLHENVSESREREIARFGADIVRVSGNYDASVRQCARDAEANGWCLVADTDAGGGDPAIPGMVMQGYTVMVQEMLDQLPRGTSPTHVFVPGGVGGLAAAVAAHIRFRLPGQPVRIVIVEPDRADCIFRSIDAGRSVPVEGDLETFMACLSAGEVSPLAWPILKRHVDDVVTLPDEAAENAMRLLATGMRGDAPVVAGESGAAAVAGTVAAGLDPDLRSRLGLDRDSIVIAIGSEGATDAETYERVVGVPASRIAA